MIVLKFELDNGHVAEEHKEIDKSMIGIIIIGCSSFLDRVKYGIQFELWMEYRNGVNFYGAKIYLIFFNIIKYEKEMNLNVFIIVILYR